MFFDNHSAIFAKKIIPFILRVHRRSFTAVAMTLFTLLGVPLLTLSNFRCNHSIDSNTRK
jgi:hypothetical protein